MTEKLLNQSKDKFEKILEQEGHIETLGRIKEGLTYLRLSNNRGAIDITDEKIISIIGAILEADMNEKLKVLKKEFEELK